MNVNAQITQQIKFTSDITVTPIQQVGGDVMIAAAAKVSVSPEEALGLMDLEKVEGIEGLIRYLIKNKHGSPTEHGLMTFFVHAPVFVFREWMRHRVGHSYNELSGRYSQLEPVFWIPRRSRKTIPSEKHKSAKPDFIPIPDGLEGDIKYEQMISTIKDSYTTAYNSYQTNLNRGISKEVARCVLPVGIYSSMWVTVNPRSLMHFLSLRTHNKNATFVSYPQAEIEEAALQCEKMFAEHWPITWKAWQEFGRVAP